MLRETPNLDWLRVFSETAASESFVIAATRLGVTSGAVSQRIKALEAFLRVELFHRYPQGVKLTEAGRRYAQRIAPALEALTAATRDITDTRGVQSVRITALPALAQLWLGPRLEAFHARESNINVEIWADPEVIDMRTSNFDVALRYGRPPFPGCNVWPILSDDLVPVASPELIASASLDDHGFPAGAALISDPYWEHDLADWLAGVSLDKPKGLRVQAISLYSMAVEAVLKGRGFMIGHSSLIGDMLDDGRLVPLSDQRVPAAKQFHVLTRAGAAPSPAADAFVRWIAEIGSEAA
ncbi:LysR substrate-binding domain-containing protein [Sphingopyxis sp.]|uniref:LysR substrate-binding domain-containing protein n=1 Tax=Sphingopyxis sp. TaxID=1908224 RepID=UPI003D0F2CB2